MSIDVDTVRKVAHLARIKVDEARLAPLADELNGIVNWVEQLGEVDTDGVAPMASVVGQASDWRKDEVTDGGYPDRVIANAPDPQGHFFTVPKVVE